MTKKMNLDKSLRQPVFSFQALGYDGSFTGFIFLSFSLFHTHTHMHTHARTHTHILQPSPLKKTLSRDSVCSEYICRHTNTHSQAIPHLCKNKLKSTIALLTRAL